MHRIGSLVSNTPAREFRPSVGSNLGGGVWEDTFTAAAPTVGGPTKFMILHFAGVTLGPGQRLEVPLGNGDTDVFTTASGPDFWTRPVKGGSVAIRFVDGGSATGSAPLTEYGRGEGIVRNGVDGGADISTTGGNANGDVFMLDTPYVDPPHFNPGGVCPFGARHWTNVAALPPGVMRDAARSTGMLIEVGEGKVSSCSAALIGPDLILTAGHCRSHASTIPSGSFTLDYETDAAGNRPAGYSPKFYKLKQGIKSGFTSPGAAGDLQPVGGGLDYGIIRIDTPPGGLGVPPLSLRPDLPAIGEEVFVIHHPRGATKKVSKKPEDPGCSVQIVQNNTVYFGGDVDNGSSGSPLFDLMGRIVGVADWAGGCPGYVNGNPYGISAQTSAAILVDIATAPPPVTDVDVMLVFDKSGSMSLPGLGGGTKIEQAREAAALFVDLLRTDRTHRVGLVTFSTSASMVQALGAISGPTKAALIGPPPGRNGGAIASIAPNGMTSIGGGLQAGRQQLVSNAGPNTPAIVLLTDGLQNTPPMITDVEAQLGNTRLCVIGFGTEGQLDGPLLTRLARDHGGIYTRANEGLALKKFFVLCFGNIFQTAIASDPFFVFPAGASSMPPIPLSICDEESITVVLSWKHASEELVLSVITPAGSTLTSTAPGVFASSGSTWVYFRLDLPFNGEREGAWQVQVSRAARGGELLAPSPEEPFFVTVTAIGGPIMRPRRPSRRYYTGDVINPQVLLRYPDGYEAHDAHVTVEIESPGNGTGNLLTGPGLGDAMMIDGDQLDRRTATLIRMEQAQGGTLVSTSSSVYPLYDDGDRDGDYALEPNGIFGNVLTDKLRYEGNYTFHARATYGHDCIGTRETMWSSYVAVGIDPGTTRVEIVATADGNGGQKQVTIRLTPQDRYGTPLGPGRSDQIGISGVTGSTPNVPMQDRGDGSYDVGVLWNPAVAPQPGVVLAQPDRPPVTITLPGAAGGAKPGCSIWVVALLAALLLIAVLLLLLR